MTKRRLITIALGGLLLLTGCTTLGGSEDPALMQAEVTALVDEATRIAVGNQQIATEIAATVAAAQTAVTVQEGVNRQLALTLRAVVPPTPQIVASSGIVTPGMNAPLVPPSPIPPQPGVGAAAPTLAPGSMQPTLAPVPPAGMLDSSNQFTAVATSAAVNEADGCAVSFQASFPLSTPRIYATTRVLNARGGTSVLVEWSFNGQAALRSSAYTIPQDDPDFCLWFFLEPTDVPFQAGSWSVQFYADNQPVLPVAQFTMN